MSFHVPALLRSSFWRFLQEQPVSIAFRLGFLLLLGAGLAVGALNRSFGVGSLATSLGITPDAVLVIFGIVNKILDYVLGDTIAHIASVSLTIWFATRTKFAGVGWHDFDLETEMLKPYIAIYRFWKRWRSSDHKLTKWDFARLFFTLACGMAVLLLGATVNVLVIPKTVWLPGTTNGRVNITTVGDYLNVPTQHMSAIEWPALEDTQSAATEGRPLQSFKLATSLIQSVSAIVPAIHECTHPDEYCQEMSYFRLVSNMAALNTTAEGFFRGHDLQYLNADLPPARYIFLQPLSDRARVMPFTTKLARDFYTKTTMSHRLAQRSSCVRNWFIPTLPIIESYCNITNTPSGNNSFTLTFEESEKKGSIRTFIGSANNNDSSFECVSTLDQWLYPTVLVGCRGNDYKFLPFESYPNTEHYNATLLNTTSLNSALLKSVSDVFSRISVLLNPFSGGSFADLISDIGIDAINSNQSLPGPRTREVGTAFAVSTAIAHLMTLAEWTFEDSGDTHSSGPIQFYVYGSGPRQMWQWVLAIIAGICFLVMFYDLYLIASKPDAAWWLGSPGLLIFANNSDKLEYPLDEKRMQEDKSTKLYARSLNGRPTLTLDPHSGKTFDRPEKEIGFTSMHDHEMLNLNTNLAPNDAIASRRQSSQPLLSHRDNSRQTISETSDIPEGYDAQRA